MRAAQCYEEWLAAAEILDESNGNQRWRRMDQSRHFDYVSIRLKLDKLRALRSRHDFPGLMFALNEGIHGNVDGMGKPELYQRAVAGTKILIEEYVTEIAESLEILAVTEVEGVSEEEKQDFFVRANHCYGRSALMLSGSGMLAYFHLGVLKALSKQHLMPDIISGSSGGSLIGSIVATRTESELYECFDIDFLHDLLERGSAEQGSLARFRQGLLKIEDLVEMIERLIPDLTFQESWEITGKNMNVSVAPKETHQTSRLLNSITSPNVLIRQAVLASCALPGVFPSVTLLARDKSGDKKEYLPSRKWVDGAISDDLPMRRLARLFGVNHYIVSQTNPHIIPFVSDTKSSRSKRRAVKVAATRSSREWINAAATVLHGPLSRRPTLNKLTNTALAVLNQDYVGDVNILPPFRISNPTRLMSPLSKSEISRLVDLGERSTWPKIEMIRTQTRISRVLRELCRHENFSSQI
jgi:NTE family protein